MQSQKDNQSHKTESSASTDSAEAVAVAGLAAREARIGLYDERLNLIGYKCDTFWSITKKPEYAKTQYLENGEIPPRLIGNLHRILTKSVTNALNGLLSGIAEINRERFYGQFETMLVAYDYPNVPPVFTHRVFPEGVEPLSVEDIATLALASTPETNTPS